MNILLSLFEVKRPLIIVAIVASFLASTAANAQLPPRSYLKTLQGMNAVPVIAMSVSGNVNPLDPSNSLDPSANLSADVAIAGYMKMFPVFDRAAMLAVLVPMGRIEGDFLAGPSLSREASSGFGDPMVEFNINLIGPPPIMNLPDLLRYEPGFSMDLVVDMAIPLGQYDNTQSLNLGQNRWYGRIGTPIVWQLGPWIPARRTTLEFFPSVWFFGDNDDFVGDKLSSDATFELEAHLTRNFTSNFWASIDTTYSNSGDTTISSTAGSTTASGSDMTLAGFTLGYQINESTQLTIGYKSTLNNDTASNDLKMSVFMISFTTAWHPLLEGVGRLSGGG
jgi:outer membrane putative beta-barrel porin/alpha-amylase